MNAKWLRVLIFVIVWIFGFVVGFWVNKRFSKPVVVYQKIVDTLKIWDTVFVYAGNEFIAKRCEEIQLRNQFWGRFSSGLLYSQFQSQSQSPLATQTLPSWGLGLHMMYDFQSKQLSPVLSARWRNYLLWLKLTNTYGVGFGIQF
jgi:hypothetical protein